MILLKNYPKKLFNFFEIKNILYSFKKVYKVIIFRVILMILSDSEIL